MPSYSNHSTHLQIVNEGQYQEDLFNVQGFKNKKTILALSLRGVLFFIVIASIRSPYAACGLSSVWACLRGYPETGVNEWIIRDARNL